MWNRIRESETTRAATLRVPPFIQRRTEKIIYNRGRRAFTLLGIRIGPRCWAKLEWDPQEHRWCVGRPVFVRRRPVRREIGWFFCGNTASQEGPTS